MSSVNDVVRARDALFAARGRGSSHIPRYEDLVTEAVAESDNRRVAGYNSSITRAGDVGVNRTSLLGLWNLY
jgi:hypothetical protein